MIIYVLGPTGSGKSTAIEFFAKKGLIPIKIDTFYQKSPRNNNIKKWFEDQNYIDHAQALFKKEIKKNYSQNLVIENTGKSQFYADFYQELSQKNKIVTILINIKLDILRERITTRNGTDYPLKQDPNRYNSYSTHPSIKINHQIDNNGSKEELIQQLQNLNLF